MSSIRLDRVGFAYPSGPVILSDLELHLSAGWTGVVGANGAGKTTLLRLIAGQIEPATGAVHRDPPDQIAVLCEQRVDRVPDGAERLAGAWDGSALRWLDRFALDPDQLARWPTLSPGERKRWQLAAALALEPDVLLLDEPTNHADSDARAHLMAALGCFRGVGLVVSHDRDLLERLPRWTLRLEPGRAALHRGGYRAAREQWEAERDADRAAWQAADDQRRHAVRLLAEARADQAGASRSQRPSARMKGPRDSDGRSMGRNTRAEWAATRAGRTAAALKTRVDQAARAAADLALEKERGAAIAVGWEPPARRRLVALDGVDLSAGPTRLAADLRGVVDRESRIHLRGPNGAGKTTLLRLLARISALPAGRLLHLEQDRSADEALARVADIRALGGELRGRLGQIVAALGMNPDLALRSRAPSPGEARKLELAVGLARRAWLLLLDEPSNHLDVPSIERVEAALAAYPGALVLVSHDDQLAARLTTTTWTLAAGRLLTS